MGFLEILTSTLCSRTICSWITNNLEEYSTSNVLQEHFFLMHTAPGAYLLHAPGAVFISNMWCDQAKSVWSLSNSVFIFLTNCMHHCHSYILQKTPLKLVNCFQRYEQLKDAKNNRKQKTFSALFDSILKSIFPTSDLFCLIKSHMILDHIWLTIFFQIIPGPYGPGL